MVGHVIVGSNQVMNTGQTGNFAQGINLFGGIHIEKFITMINLPIIMKGQVVAGEQILIVD
jgi:hypothetical protein